MIETIFLDDVIEQAQPFSRQLEILKESFSNSKKIIAITGAGISVSAGIPDFRSDNGLYQSKLTKQSKKFSGKDFFDVSFFNSSITRPLFNKFVAKLHTLCSSANPTSTHKWLSKLYRNGRLIRWYTQNIDGLEKNVGCSTTSCLDNNLKSSKSDKNTKIPVVNLHGSLNYLFCIVCNSKFIFQDLHRKKFDIGDNPDCQKCIEFHQRRIDSGKRAPKIGFLRPDIVLYNEMHPEGEFIANLAMKDMTISPNLLVVIGTSLKIVGLKKMIKDFVKSMKNGLVVFINKTECSTKEWDGIFDYQLIGECDKWIGLLDSQKKLIDGKIPFKIIKNITHSKTKETESIKDNLISVSVGK